MFEFYLSTVESRYWGRQYLNLQFFELVRQRYRERLVFIVAFQGNEPIAARCFRQIARLTKGAYLSFDAASARQLRDLLGAVAVYAAGGRRALEDLGKRAGGAVLQIAGQVK